MILIGDKIVPFKEFNKISSKNDIEKSRANSIVSFGYNETLLIYCFENNISFAVIISNIKEAIYANSLNAKYLICNKTLATDVQKIADNYMFDSKVLAIIESNDEIEDIALNQIDGIIYKSLI